MKARSIIVCVLVGITMIILFSSCHVFTLDSYNVGFRNLSGHEVNVFHTSKIGNYAPPVGTLSGWQKGIAGSGSHCGIPPSVTIEWEKGDGKVIEKEVKVEENMPQGFWNGDTIIFNINDNDDVVLSFQMRGHKHEIDTKGNEFKFK